MSHTLVILAAGAGRRYGGQKQLAPVGPNGEALLEYSVYDALRAGFSRVVLVVQPEAAASFRRRLASMARSAPIVYAHQRVTDIPPGFPSAAKRTKPWGTGHALLAAEAMVEGSFAVLNADDFYGAESLTILADFLNRPAAGSRLRLAMVPFELGATLSESGSVSRALCRLAEDGLLRDIVEIDKVWTRNRRIFHLDDAGRKVTLRGDEPVSMNLWAFPREFFTELRLGLEEFLTIFGDSAVAEFLLPDLVRSLLGQGRARVEALPGAADWCGITYREDKRRAAARIAELVARGIYPSRLWR